MPLIRFLLILVMIFCAFVATLIGSTVITSPYLLAWLSGAVLALALSMLPWTGRTVSFGRTPQ